MKQKAAFVLIVLLLFALPLFGRTVTFVDNWGEEGFNLISSSERGVEIVYSMNHLTFEEMMVEDEVMQIVSISGMILPNDEGAPNLPGMGKFIAVPQGAKVELEVVSSRKEVYEDINIVPAPNIPAEVDDSPLKYVKDPEIYNANEYYPASPVQMSSLKKMRGVDIVILGITPFQYNPVTKELIVYTDIRVKLNFIGGTGHFGEDRLRSRWFEPVLYNNIMNYGSLPSLETIEQMRGSKPRAGECEYIIIVPDDPDFIAWADTVKYWRKKQGILTDVYKITDPEIGSNTVSAIEDFIDDAYNTWSIPPVAVLLMSDYQSSGKAYGITSPSYTHPYSGTYITDNTYADVDGDGLPEMNFARLTAQDAGDLEEMVYKFMDYEQRNPPTDADYYDHPLMACGWQNDRWFQLCTEIVRGFFINELLKTPNMQYNLGSPASPSPGGAWSTNSNTYMLVDYFGESGLGYIPDTNPYNSSWWNTGSASGVNSDINDGAFLVQHRDHGGESGWGEPDYTISNLSGLSNDLLTFVFSINCLTGRFDYSSEVFTEAFHRMQHGAFGLLAATQVSYSFVNDAYIFGLYDGMWPFFDPGNAYSSQQDTFVVNLRPGFASVSGKYYLEASSWPYNSGSKAITYDLFHLHCDAFITLFSEVPESLDVTHDATVPLGASNFTVTVRESNGMTPVDSALVCCWCGVDDDMWVRGHTNSAGEVTLSINPSEPVDSMWVTVTKYDHFRYEKVVYMASGCPSVPILHNLFDYARDFTTTPKLSFASTDEEGNEIEYEVSWDTDPGLSSPSTGMTGLYNSGAIASFTFLSPLVDGETYYWRVRGRDPSGSGYWGGGSEIRCFTIGTALPESTATWYQTKGSQFDDDILVDVAVQGDAVILPTAGGTIVDTVYYEDFQSGLPSRWTVIDGNGDGYEWEVGMCSAIGSYTPPDNGNSYAYYDDDAAGSGNENTNEELISCSIEIPSNCDGLEVSYGWGFRQYESGEEIRFRARFYNGGWGSWTTVYIHTGGGLGTHVEDLTGYLPADSVQFDWLYNDEGSYYHWSYACAVDNVRLIRTRILLNTDGTITGTPVAYEDLASVYARTLWGSVTWDKSAVDDSISIQVEYLSGGIWDLVPDDDLPGNSLGFLTETVSGTLSVSGLSTITYDTLRLRGNLYRKPGKASDDPSLLAWEIGNLSGELAVFLAGFDASEMKGKVKLFWRTESEIDNAYWLVERGVDPRDSWQQITMIEGQGTKPAPTEYEYIDAGMEKDGEYFYRLIAVNGDGERTLFGPVSVMVRGKAPRVFALHKLSPNPCSGRLAIRYDIPRASFVNLKVYNVIGQVVRMLVHGNQEPDYYKVIWDGKNDGGKMVAFGVYFVRLDTDRYTKTHKLLLVK
jgi:hypothetical protein